MISDIFKSKVANFEKLKNYGFKREDGVYSYKTTILGGDVSVEVKIDEEGNIKTETVDLASEEVYSLHLVESAQGAFVGSVRAEFENLLCDIRDKCFETKIFNDISEKVIAYSREKYGSEPEFLWADTPDICVLRRQNTSKWFAALLVIPKSRLGLEGDERVNIIDLRMKPEELISAVNGKNYFLGYHMNKKHWVTILLDGSVAESELIKRIDDSFALAM